MIFFPDWNFEEENDTNDFEAIQSSNWNDVRLKPPPSLNCDLGWRLEFRVMDTPITEREKTALTALCVIFQRMIVSKEFKINLYIPMSIVLSNFEKSNALDSITS